MSENLTARLWLMRAAFVALAFVVIFWQLLPMETVPRRFTGPDVLMVLCVLWECSVWRSTVGAWQRATVSTRVWGGSWSPYPRADDKDGVGNDFSVA